MLKKGMQFTCNGCGRKKFVQTDDPKIQYLDHTVHFSEELELSEQDSVGNIQDKETWSRVVLRFDLCPYCQEKWQDAVCSFYEKANHDAALRRDD